MTEREEMGGETNIQSGKHMKPAKNTRSDRTLFVVFEKGLGCTGVRRQRGGTRMRLKPTSSKTKTGFSCESKDGREAAAAAGGRVEAAEEAAGAEGLVVNTLPGGA
jgi:hypothetical protein